MFVCRVETDSINPRGDRAASFLITFPRMVLAEVITHRVCCEAWGDLEASWCERTTTSDISKNSASSRAIPFQTMVDKVFNDPYIPKWTLKQKGMQGQHTDDEEIIRRANGLWLGARNDMIARATELDKLGVHKQDCNRLLEPWGWITQIVTSSRWDNFFALRCHSAAHPAFQRIARMMFLQLRRSTPRELEYGQWHLPFIHWEIAKTLSWVPNHPSEPWKEDLPQLVKMSAARCAWLSYENHDRDATDQAHLNTYDRLLKDIPKHASPIEHQLTPMHYAWESAFPKLRSNIPGYIQARKLIQHEVVEKYDPPQEEIDTWGMKEYV